MKEPEMELIGSLIAETLSSLDSEEVIASVRVKVKSLTSQFPLYADLVKKSLNMFRGDFPWPACKYLRVIYGPIRYGPSSVLSVSHPYVN